MEKGSYLRIFQHDHNDQLQIEDNDPFLNDFPKALTFMPMIAECKRLTTAVQQIDNLKVNLLLSYLPWYKKCLKY